MTLLDKNFISTGFQRLDDNALDLLMPMHLRISETGHILHAGPTLSRLRSDVELVGSRLLELVEFRRPRIAVSYDDLRAAVGQKLSLKFRNPPHTSLKGVLIKLPGDAGLLLNLSFGISVVEAVGDYNLTNADFAPTDLAIEMLYLVEAKTAVMNESRNLNMRLQGARIAAEEQAFTDTLTGLKNRRALDHILSRLIAVDAPFALMQLDLDYFKTINDTLGHAAGDAVLQQVAKVLVSEIRDADTVARVGGDEFVLLLDRLLDPDKLQSMARRMIKQLEIPLMFDGEVCKISGSIGVTTTKLYDVVNAEKMMADADTALYSSKHKGRGCATLVTKEMLAQAPEVG